VDVGGSTAGLQFTLARSGHFVHNVDPGLKATGKGWAVDDKFHHFLATVYRAPVSLHCTTLPGAGFAERSIDVVVSVSAIEHFSQQDIEDFAREARRLLFPGGYVVLTVDLFLDLIPFSTRLSNVFGINVSVAGVIESLGAQIVVGDRAELYGFPEFDAQLIQSRLAEFLIGDPYPALTQCVVACLE
jgi:SAM-dependent methyltransferase